MSGALGRRQILHASALGGLGLLVGCHVGPEVPPPAAAPGSVPLPPTSTGAPGTAPSPALAPNAWVRVGVDGTVTLVIDKAEMGQGILTGLAILIAEELECEWSTIRTEFAPADPAYKNPIFGSQATGGSTSTVGSWEPLRRAGATARLMLVAAAAAAWGVDPSTCRAERGQIAHAPSGRRVSFGSVVVAASKLPVPSSVPLKPSSAWHLIGTRVPRLDAAEKARGETRFGIDVQIPDMLVAVVVRAPSFGARVGGVDASKASGMPGVRRVLSIDSGVAVVADTYWNARRAAGALHVDWGPAGTTSSESLHARCAELAKTAGVVAEKKGDAAAVLARARKKLALEAVYTLPFQAHATMEPMNCTASARASSCEVWAPTQSPDAVLRTATKLTGLPPSSIQVHTTFLGGGFGRRFESDFVAEAIALSMAMQAPVKVVWSREDDMQHDFYRPCSYNVVRAALGGDGLPVAWTHRAVSDSIFERVFPDTMKNGLDRAGVEGAVDLPYAIPNTLVDWHKLGSGVPVGFWRSVGHSLNAFVVESFVDELAALAKIDPVEYRRRLMVAPGAARQLRTLEVAAAKSGWSVPLGPGRGRGIATHGSFRSHVTHVAEVTLSPDGQIAVERVVCAVDCGTVVNVDQVEAQMEGAIVYGLSAALKGQISIASGGAKQDNFNMFELLEMREAPAIEVHVVESDAPPGGCGEPGVPPVAPAVANAVFAATHVRLRDLPLRLPGAKRS